MAHSKIHHQHADAALDHEMKCIAALAKARHDAASLLADFFASTAEATKEQLATVRVAIQFTARAFRPLEQLLKLAFQEDDPDDAEVSRPKAARTRKKSNNSRRQRASTPFPDGPTTSKIDLTTTSILNSDVLLC